MTEKIYLGREIVVPTVAPRPAPTLKELHPYAPHLAHCEITEAGLDALTLSQLFYLESQPTDFTGQYEAECLYPYYNGELDCADE